MILRKSLESVCYRVDRKITILLQEGLDIVLSYQRCNFKGTVSIVSADNPASQAIGGFKESSMAFRNCRLCLGTSEDIQTKVTCISTYMPVYI